MRPSRRLLLLLALSTVGLVACRREKTAASAGALASVAVSGGGVTVDVIATESWPGGFNGAVRVTNDSFPQPITSFSIVFKLAGTASVYGGGRNQTISTPDASGNRTCVSPSWLQYQPIRSGTSWEEGFSGRGTFAGSTIVSVTVNGQAIPVGDGADTTPPTVAIQSNAATVTAPTAVTLTATARDDVGVARVDFYDGATLLGSTTAAPYVLSVPLTAADNGTHAFIARAFDAANNSATSSPANVLVEIPPRDTEPPTIFLVSSALDVTAASTITLMATAADDVGVARVEFYEGETLLGTRTSAPYELPISFTTPGHAAHTYTARAFDAAGNSGTSAAVIVSVQIQEPDLAAPTVAFTSSSTKVTTASTVTLLASATDDVGVARVEFYEGETLLGIRSSAPYELLLSFTSADNGAHSYTARAFDQAGNASTSAAVDVSVEIRAADTVSPMVSLAASATSVTTAATVTLIATASDDVGVARVEFYEGTTLLGTRADAPYELSIAFTSADNGVHAYTARAFDAANNSGTSTDLSIAVEIGTGTWVPPDPATVAPPNDLTAATDIADATAFLYTGSNPIQVGVPEGTIEVERVAVLRGHVRGRDMTPIGGVRITVLGHPEYGETRTREDGTFDLAVNGGGRVTLDYRKDGYLGAQRQVEAPWRDFAWADDVILVPYDEARTQVALGAASMQLARGGLVSDARGERRVTVAFPPGLQASMVLADGARVPLSTMHVRGTEFTVGPDGLDAMPAQLPPTSAYTYAVALTAEEAVAGSARIVEFDRPVPVYVENFLSIPVGWPVPSGYYDEAAGAWIPEPDGRVIKILSIAEGSAVVDADGDGQADAASALAALGVTAQELATLASTYSPGQELWRVPVGHFSTFDFNFSWGCPSSDNAAPCAAPEANVVLAGEDDECSTEVSGSRVECQNQVLGEDVPIAGTPFSLTYQSDRQHGRTADRTIAIKVPANAPSSSKGLIVEAYVAGQRLRQKLPTSDRDMITWTWDGRDAYGRPVQGAAPVVVRMGYVYEPVYMLSYVSGGGASGGGQAGASYQGQSFASTPWAGPDLTSWPGTLPFSSHYVIESQFVSWTTWRGMLSNWTELPTGLGGWSLSPRHSYDSTRKVLYRGDGARAGASPVAPRVITSLPAKEQWWATAIALGPDGSIYTASDWAVIRRDASGNLQPYAGGGVGGCRAPATGVPATSLCFKYLADVAMGPDDLVYFPLDGQVLKVRADQTIEIVAGRPTADCGAERAADGAVAVGACIGAVEAIAFGPDGALYLASSKVVRKISPGGMLATVAGAEYSRCMAGTTSLNCCSFGDGGPATRALICDARGLAIGQDGSVYVSQANKVRRVKTDGTITTVAGSTPPAYYDPAQTGAASGGPLGDGGLATQALLSSSKLSVAPDGSLLISDHYNARIRRVGTDGMIDTVAGRGALGTGGWTDPAGDGGPALSATLNYPYHAVTTPTGELLIADSSNLRVRKVSAVLPGFSLTDQLIPSGDGSEVYVVDARGRHLRTVDAIAGVTRYTFGYDEAGRLSSVTDANGLTTTIEHAGDRPTAIIAPYGQRTILSVDGNGYLHTVTNPAGETWTFSYDANGLLTRYVDQRGGEHVFAHDEFGRLTGDANPAGGSWTLARTELPDGFRVSVSSALGRTTVHDVTVSASGDQTTTSTAPDGTSTQHSRFASGRTRTTSSDGTVLESTFTPDPRFGMKAPHGSSTVATPSGITRSTAESVSVTLEDSSNPLSLTSWTRRSTVNGRTFTFSYDASKRTITTTTAGGRVSRTVLDERGRPAQLTVSGMLPIQLQYDERGRVDAAVQGLRASSFAYDSRGRVQAMTGADGRSVAFSYDLADRVVGMALPGGREVILGYDPAGNLTSVAPPSRPAHGFEYTPKDQVSSYEPPLATGAGLRSTTYAYDVDGSLSSMVLPDESTVVPTYDPAGRLAAVTTSRGTSEIGYDGAGRVATVTTGDGGSLAYTYDGGLMTSETLTGAVEGTVGWSYDSDFRVASTFVSGTEISYQYDPDSLLTGAGALAIGREAATGRVSSTTLGTVGTASGYGDYGELSAFTATTGSAGLYSYTLARDLAGRITGKTETVQGVTTTYVYGYDEAGRLETVTRNGAPVASYAYDENGNRLAAVTPAGSAAGTYDLQDRLLAYGSAAYTYRPNGELESKTVAGQGTHYDYDAFGNLRGVLLPDSRQIEYVIDGANRRVGKRVDGALVEGFLYEGKLRPVAWLNGAGEVYARFVYGLHVNVPEYMVTETGTFRFLTDHLGSVRLVVNASTGAVAQRIDYDEWGQVLQDTNPGFQPFGFAGGLYDGDTGLVRFGARDYDPSVGRWTSKDPLGLEGGLNVYEYCENDPINRLDPVGLYSWWEFELDAGNFFAGFGSVVSLGLTDWVNEQTGADVAVNRCSGAFTAGKWAGWAHTALSGVAGGLKAAGAKGLGKEFSHWIPNRLGGPRSILNGNFVSSARHYLHDPFRYPPGWQNLGPKLPVVLQQLDRIPNVWKGLGIGVGWGSTGMALSE